MASVSSLTSISSRASIETYESFKEEIVSIDLPECQREVHACSSKSNTCRKGSEMISIGLDVVTKAILAFAEECRGQR